MMAMHGTMAWKDEPHRTGRSWRLLAAALVLVAAAGVAGLIMFSWMSALPVTGRSSIATYDARPGDQPSAPASHMRF